MRLACLLALLLPACQTAPRRPPNILFLFADDQRADTIGAFGNEYIQTPNLDRLVTRGFSFRSNYCMGSWHGAVCIASRAMLMTGQTLFRVKPDMTSAKTLPQVLGEAGYATFATGKWHNGQASFERSFRRGRNIMFGGMCDHRNVPLTQLDPASRKFSQPLHSEGPSSRVFASAAIEFLKEQSDAQPFFAYVAFTAPHDPRDPTDQHKEFYRRVKPPLPPNFRAQVEWFADETWARVRDEQLAPWPRTRDVLGDQLAEYYGLVADMDEMVGAILDALEATGQRDNTIIVFAADHGLALGSHGLVGKQSVYEHSMACPLILAGPGIPRGETRSLTYLHDLYPTLLRRAAVEVPATAEGHDLMPVVAGERDSVRDSLFLAYAKTQRSVRDDRFKLIRFPEIDKTLLFDLRSDPHEITNLASRPEQADRVRSMTRTLVDWQRVVDDRAPLEVASPRAAQVDLTGTPRKPDRWQPRWIREKYF